MKKSLFALLLCTLLMLCASAGAALNPVADNASLLTQTQADALADTCRALAQQYDLDVIIATTNDSRGMELGAYAADLVDYNQFKTDNIILVIAMDQRKYVCVTTGKGIAAFSDQALESLYDAMESDMRAGDYYSACQTYLRRCEHALAAYQAGDTQWSGTAASGNTQWSGARPRTAFTERMKTAALMALLPAVAIGWSIAAAQKRRMKTSRRQHAAHDYMTGMSMTRARDIFLYTTTVRRKIENNSPPAGHHPSGGSHATFSGSSGRSHGGGGGGRGF